MNHPQIIVPSRSILRPPPGLILPSRRPMRRRQASIVVPTVVVGDGNAAAIASIKKRDGGGGGGGGGSIALVSRSAANSGISFSNQTGNQTFDFTGVTAGNLIVIVAALYEAFGLGGAFANATSSNGTVQNALKPTPMQLASTDSVGIAAWFIPNANSGTHTIGYDPTGSTTGSYGRVLALEFTNMISSTAVANTNSTSDPTGATSSSSGATGVLSSANRLVIGAMMLETDDASISTPATFFQAYNSGNTLDVGFEIAWKEVSATTTQTASWTWGATQENQSMIFTFNKD